MIQWMIITWIEQNISAFINDRNVETSLSEMDISPPNHRIWQKWKVLMSTVAEGKSTNGKPGHRCKSYHGVQKGGVDLENQRFMAIKWGNLMFRYCAILCAVLGPGKLFILDTKSETKWHSVNHQMRLVIITRDFPDFPHEIPQIWHPFALKKSSHDSHDEEWYVTIPSPRLDVDLKIGFFLSPKKLFWKVKWYNPVNLWLHEISDNKKKMEDISPYQWRYLPYIRPI